MSEKYHFSTVVSTSACVSKDFLMNEENLTLCILLRAENSTQLYILTSQLQAKVCALNTG